VLPFVNGIAELESKSNR